MASEWITLLLEILKLVDVFFRLLWKLLTFLKPNPFCNCSALNVLLFSEFGVYIDCLFLRWVVL